ncbi:MAG TPA: T9SS type A sorting domain-containing protein [Bacteroidota bacterium]|nr:T9SS type A sorting domain-containing protein [Bacteroidota bacterium]
MSVVVKAGIPESQMRSLRDSANAVLIERYYVTDSASVERWQVTGKTVDSLAAALSNDFRLRWVEVERVLWSEREIVTSVPSFTVLPGEFSLHQNYPNPFNPATVIRFTLPGVGTRHEVSLRVFNMLGQEVATLVNGEMEAGHHQVQWQAEGLPSGVYFYRLEAGRFVETKKMMLVR